MPATTCIGQWDKVFVSLIQIFADYSMDRSLAEGYVSQYCFQYETHTAGLQHLHVVLHLPTVRGQMVHENDDVDFPQPCPERLCFKSTKHMCRFSFPKNDDTHMVGSQHLDEEVVAARLNGRVVETEELHFGDDLPSLLDDEDSSNVECSTISL